ncbi:MAG: AAA family ATPase [Polymorphobacter sp.]|uniref:AAA family ATPase n=1 Tax=Polymorphobacter sp. TaxID=1909290 RepID=UPI003A8AB8F7
MQFAPLQWPVPGLLPEGLALIGGKPKLGKSFMALDLALAVTGAKRAMGIIACQPGHALYCALEDCERRLQTRIAAMMPAGAPFPERLDLVIEMKRLGEGGEEQLERWLDAHPDARLIIIDTWRCIKPASDGRKTGYDEDAAGMQRLHAIAKHRPGLCILVVHHTRKQEADDPMDMISGTTGLTGVPDTLLVLARHGEGARLVAVSREMDGYDKALKRNPDTNGWTIIGDAKQLAATAERQEILEALEGAPAEGLSSRDVADTIGKSEPTVRRTLNRMAKAGEVQRLKRGRFACPNGPNVPKPKAAPNDDWDNGTDETGRFDHDEEDD